MIFATIILLAMLAVGCSSTTHQASSSESVAEVAPAIIMPPALKPMAKIAPVQANTLTGNFAVVGYVVTNGVVELVAQPIQNYGWIWSQPLNSTNSLNASVTGLWHDQSGIIVQGAVNFIGNKTIALQQSDDLSNWQTIGCVTSSEQYFEFQEDTNPVPCRFYRLKTFSTHQ